MNLSGSHVLITGGTGTFGTAMTTKLLDMRDGPAKVSILSRDEVKQAQMRETFRHDVRLRFTLGDVRDPERLAAVFPGVDYIFHAAALKRIEACAYDPTEAIRTNVTGSVNVLRAAIHAGVQKIVALSSDKAAAPSTTYGATKLCMEAVFTSSAQQAGRAGHGTACAVVRYGNVAGSRGSVIPTWRQAHKAGTSVVIHDPEATRFWFTIQDAVEFALWALADCTGGELYVPELPAFKLHDLACAMSLDGVVTRVDPVVPRPGEKRHEVMISPDEATQFQKAWRVENAPVFIRRLAWSDDDRVRLPDGFSLSSLTARRMSVEELREALRTV